MTCASIDSAVCGVLHTGQRSVFAGFMCAAARDDGARRRAAYAERDYGGVLCVGAGDSTRTFAELVTAVLMTYRALIRTDLADYALTRGGISLTSSKKKKRNIH